LIESTVVSLARHYGILKMDLTGSFSCDFEPYLASSSLKLLKAIKLNKTKITYSIAPVK